MSKQLRSLTHAPAPQAAEPSRDIFLHDIRHQYASIKITMSAIKRASWAFHVEAIIGLSHYSSLKKAVDTVYDQLHAMVSLLEPSDQLPDAVRPYRYSLQILLRTTGKQAEELLRLLGLFRRSCLLSSSPDIFLQHSIFSQARKLLTECEEIDVTISTLGDRSRFLESQLLALR
jgi:hypothetical protein